MRASVLALLLAAGPAAAAGFPRANEVFTKALADPRAPGLGVSYYRQGGEHKGDAALGHSWGLSRWRLGSGLEWLFQADVEGLAYSRFKLGGGVNEFETVDFSAAVPLSARAGDVSFKLTLYHESSHLGDDYIRRTGDTGFRYSLEGVKALAAVEPFDFLRGYVGPAVLFHAVPAQDPWALRSGVELSWRRFFAAHDLHWRERSRWGPESHVVAGLRLSFRDSPGRSLRLQGGHFSGPSPFGQFFRRHERYTHVSVALDL